ncbi:MAG: response regulator transcription factor [Clostridia bacterium]|nr:response regulator transcription factor [Clostridia bacterium]
MIKKNHILIIDSDNKIVNFISMALKAQGYKVTSSSNGKSGILAFCTGNPDVIIMDIDLPDSDGINVIEQIREVSQIPIAVISTRNIEHDKIQCLDKGANDYIMKPFSMGEVLARIRVLERYIPKELAMAENKVFTFPDLEIDTEKRRVTLEGKEIHFTPMEYKLLVLLASNAGKVITHRQIAKEVWDYGETGDAKSIRVCTASLRRKLEKDTSKPQYIFTEVGVGYRFTDFS